MGSRDFTGGMVIDSFNNVLLRGVRGSLNGNVEMLGNVFLPFSRCYSFCVCLQDEVWA
jgi:hypothetical protein